MSPAAGEHTAEALTLLAELDAELAHNTEALGLQDDPLVWSATERKILDMIACAVDRQVDLWARYKASDEDKVRVKLSTELRLLEQTVAKLLKQVDTDLPAPESQTTQRARRAADTRWARERARAADSVG